MFANLLCQLPLILGLAGQAVDIQPKNDVIVKYLNPCSLRSSRSLLLLQNVLLKINVIFSPLLAPLHLNFP
jgi:hypothetical protein